MDPVERAFSEVKRENFVPQKLHNQAYIDAPLPIGFGQTISQPTTVKMMLHWLQAEPGDRVLDIGSGSGWTSALLAHIVGPRGQVFAVEKIPELLEFGKENCRSLNLVNVQFYLAIDEYGLSKHAPYQRILVSASASEFPDILLTQLKINGKLVLPVKNDVLEITKNSEKDYKTVSHPGFIFVPLIKN